MNSEKILKDCEGVVMKTLKRLIIIAATIIVAAAGIIYFNILYSANHAMPEKSDAIIVLGCKAKGETPSPLLEYRLKKALELYNDGYGSTIITSGGQGYNESLPESSVMKKWLVSHNVPEAAIIEENLSTSTFENLKNSKAIMEKRNLKTAVIVSNNFHIFRSLLLARRLGISCSAAAAQDDAYTRIFYRSREVVSVVKSLIFDK